MAGSSTDATARQTVAGIIQRIVYQAPDTGWCVAQGVLEDGASADTLTTLVGRLAHIPPQMPHRFIGRWTTHPRYGRQFVVDAAVPQDPVTPQAAERYLLLLKCPGLGPKTAAKMVQQWGPQVITLLRNNPAAIASLKGVTLAKASQWQHIAQQAQEWEHVMTWLLQYDVDPGVARRLYDKLGARTVEEIQKNPYQLTQEVWGIGFHTADRIALSLGWPPLGEERMKALWRLLLQTALSTGDCYRTTDQLLTAACELLKEHDAPTLTEILTRMMPTWHERQGFAVVMPPNGTETHWSLSTVHRWEQRLVADILRHSSQRPDKTRSLDWAWMTETARVTYAPAQQAAITGALQAPFGIITGGPGTGKTTTLRGLLTWLVDHEGLDRQTIALAAPTARAAKRMEEVTGFPAYTLHRLLEWSPQQRKFTHDDENPLQARWIIVDETSMVDLPLATAFWRAVHPATHVLWLGDEQQLPSVGPGSVLKDIIASGRIPVWRLAQNFRSQSGIATAAHALLAHQVPSSNRDVTIRRYPKGANKETVQRDLLQTVQTFIHHGTPWQDIQVLSPIRRGLLGTDALNVALRDALNPATAHNEWRAANGASFRLGDRVTQTRNRYDKGVFNGDIGWVVRFGPAAHPNALGTLPNEETDEDEAASTGVWVHFGADPVWYSAEEAATDLRLAYATTVHKSQGAEYPIVILPVFYDAYMMLYRNLIYTALTRAKRHAVIMVEAQALWLALKRGDSATRQTHLTEYLQNPPSLR